TGATPAIVFASLLKETPVPPSEMNRAIPRELDKIISKALEKDTSLRYQRAADIREDLQRLKKLSERSGPAGLEQAGSQEIQPVPRRLREPLPWIAMIGVMISLLLAGFFLWMRNRRPT